jgi:hypothetical protein
MTEFTLVVFALGAPPREHEEARERHADDQADHEQAEADEEDPDGQLPRDPMGRRGACDLVLGRPDQFSERDGWTDERLGHS